MRARTDVRQEYEIAQLQGAICTSNVTMPWPLDCNGPVSVHVMAQAPAHSGGTVAGVQADIVCGSGPAQALAR